MYKECLFQALLAALPDVFMFSSVCVLHLKWCDAQLAAGYGISPAKCNSLHQIVLATSMGMCVWEGVSQEQVIRNSNVLKWHWGMAGSLLFITN